MAPDEIFSYIPVPEHPQLLRQMLPTDAEDGLALLAYYRNSFISACTRRDKNTADCILDIIIHLRYRLIKLGEFLEDPASYLFAVYYEQSLPCMIYGTPLKIDFSPACDLVSLMAEIDIDEGIEVADDAVELKFGDIDMSDFDDAPAVVSAQSVESKKGKKKKAKKSKKPSIKVEKVKVSPKERCDFFPKFDSPPEPLPDLSDKASKARNRALVESTSKYLDAKQNNAAPEDLGVIECDIWDCLNDLVVCSRGKEAVKLLEVLHPVEVVEDGTIRVTKTRMKAGYEAADYLFRGCPSSRDWLLSRRL